MPATYPFTLQQFGGADDGATDTSGPVASALANMPAGATLVCPWTNTGNYTFSGNNTNLAGVVLAPDAGVTFTATDATVPILSTAGVRTTQNLRLHYSDLNFNYTLSSAFQEGFEKKRLWLTADDADTTVYQGLALNSLINETASWPSGDVWTPAGACATVNGSEPYPFINWNSLSSVQWYASTLPVRGGDELSASFDTPGRYNRAAFVRTTAGYYCVYANGGGTAPVLVTKLTGQSAISVTLGANAACTTQPQYYPENSVWTLRILDRFHFEVLLNGVSVTGIVLAAGAIFRGGFGVMASPVTSMSVSGWVRARGKPQGGKAPLRVVTYGDSLSADIHGGWPYAMREALDGSAGVRVGAVTNHAVAGYTSAQALSAMTSTPPAGYDVCVIGIGTNDVQTGQSVTTCLNNIASMVAICASNGVTPVLWVFPLWYTQAEAGSGNGQPSGNSGGGSAIRAAIMRYCGVNRIACVDLTQVTGPIDVRYLQGTFGVSGADPMVRDNIHPTAYAYRLIGHAVARRILGIVTPKSSRAVTYQNPSPAWSGLNGWTSTAINYAVSESGIAQLAGVMTNPGGASVADGTTFMQLPEHLRPIASVRFPCYVGLSTGGYATACIQIDTIGNCTVYGLAGSIQYFSLDTCSYPTAG